MSVSPQLMATPISHGGGQASSQSHLAALLTDAYNEVETLRHELSIQRKRADNAENLVKSLSLLRGHPASAPILINATNNGATAASSSPPTPAATTSVPNPNSMSPSSPPRHPLSQDEAIRLLLEHEERANRAEQERDEAAAHRLAVADCWSQLHVYLSELDNAAVDARIGFDRIVKENGGQLVLPNFPALPSAEPPVVALASNRLRYSRPQGTGSTTTKSQSFPSLPLPPYPNSVGVRRARTPSVDSYSSQPPSKRSRGDFIEPTHSYIPSNHASNQPVSLPHQQGVPLVSQHQHQQHHPQPQNQSLSRIIFPPGPTPPSVHHVITASGTTSSSRHYHRPSTNHRSRSRSRPSNSRSSSRSSHASMSVDEMLLEATTDGSTAAPPPLTVTASSTNGYHAAPSETPRPPRIRRSGSQRSVDMQPPQQQPQPGEVYDYGPNVQRRVPTTRYHEYQAPQSTQFLQQGQEQGRAEIKPQPHLPGPTSGQREFQTHVFAPVVTGAPQKKAKFPGSGAPSIPQNTVSASGIGGEPGAPVAAYPPTNEQGQRICRQCGMPGRYKEGKCVEKWGPGPMGPGTVCDRCRKKMKRVERRGTLELQQQQQQQQQASHRQTQPQPRPLPSQPQAQPLHPPIHRTDTIPVSQPPHLSFGSSHLRTGSGDDQPARPVETSSSPPLQSSGTATVRSPMPPPPAAVVTVAGASPQSAQGMITLHDEIPTSAIGRGSEAAANAKAGAGGIKRAKSKNGNGVVGRGADANVAGKKPGNMRTSKSPGVTEADADADADAETEAEIEAEIEGLVGLRGSSALVTTVEGKVEVNEVEADVELLEAVDAAEANSIASSSDSVVGGSKEGDV